MGWNEDTQVGGDQNTLKGTFRACSDAQNAGWCPTAASPLCGRAREMSLNNSQERPIWVARYSGRNESLYIYALENKTVITKLTLKDYLIHEFKQISWNLTEDVLSFSLCGGNDGLFRWRMKTQKPYYARMKKRITVKVRAQPPVVKSSVPVHQRTVTIRKGRQTKWKSTDLLV